MKYSELIQFQPIESVIELRQANKAAKAKELASTYVISDPMADRLCDLVIPQLQYAKPQDREPRITQMNADKEGKRKAGPGVFFICVYLRNLR